MQEGESILVRHADKGKWRINEEELLATFPKDQAALIKSVLSEETPDSLDIPLKLEGLKRAIKLAEEIFSELPNESVLIVANSPKDRAQLTSALVTARLHQMETQYNKTHQETPKRIDMLKIDSEEISKMLADAHESTWKNYGEMVDRGEVSELEAMAKWIMDTNKSESKINYEISPKEAGQRYRQIIQNIRSSVIGGKVPVIFLGIGHSGALAQIDYEQNPGAKTANDMPDFCEIHKFDSAGNLIAKKKVEV